MAMVEAARSSGFIKREYLLYGSLDYPTAPGRRD
jgi:hypothetical protein